jgi:phage terminase Nu1 subunit (DNA packaging protein)
MTETTTLPATMKKGDFAHKFGFGKSLNALAAAGLVVFDGDRVDVKKSQAAIDAAERLMNKSTFAAYIGVSLSHITALGDEGRLCLLGEGRYALIWVEESLKKIEDTGGSRTDVAARFAAARRADDAHVSWHMRSTSENAPKRDSESHDPERLVDAKTRKESAQADQEEMKAAQMAGNLIAREDVDAAMKFLGASVRAAMDVFPDQTAPVLCAVTDLNETHALLTEACRNVLHDIGVAIERQQKALRGGA